MRKSLNKLFVLEFTESLIVFNNNFSYHRLCIFLFLFLSIISCKSEYEKIVLRERASGITKDSLFLGMKMGITRQEYFEACAALNKDSLLQQGKGSYAYYEIPLLPNEDSIKRKEVNFTAFFDDKKIVRGMQFSFNYRAWSPWATELHSDKLLLDLKQRIENEYSGNKFIEVHIEGFKDKVFVKIDGNRRMLMYPLSNQEVRLMIEDLIAKEKLKKK